MVMVYCEGPTEWYVIRKLNKHGILNDARIINIDDAEAHIENSPSKITESFIITRPREWKKFLFVYDQEDHSSPLDFVNKKFAHLSPWNQVNQNIFCRKLNDDRLIYLHVNDALSPNEYGDFDGYLIKLVNKLGSKSAQLIFRLLPEYIRQTVNPPNVYSAIHQIGTLDIPELMQHKGFPLQRSKGQICAYITASQVAKSHVWFAEKFIEMALKNGFANYVQQVFNSLIEAWNRLIRGQYS